MSGFSYNSDLTTTTTTTATKNADNSASVAVLNSTKQLSRKLSEQRDSTFVSSPEEFVQKFGGNRVIKKVIGKIYK